MVSEPVVEATDIKASTRRLSREDREARFSDTAAALRTMRTGPDKATLDVPLVRR